MKIKRLIAALLLAVLVLGMVSCNEPTVEPDASGSEATEKATKKPSKQEETEPPTVLEDVTGLDLDIKLLSQNLSRSERANGNSHEERISRFDAMIADIQPDVIATQEATVDWTKHLKRIEGYAFIGHSSAGTKSTSGEWNAILYNEERFVLMDSGTFWVADATKSPSYTTGAMDRRICTWAELFDRYTGQSLVVASSQLDSACEEVRTTQLGQLVRALKAALSKRFNNMPVYLTLDLKSDKDGNVYFDMIANRGFDDARNLANEDISTVSGTYHFMGAFEEGREQNFWFARGYDEVLSYEIISKKYKGKNDTEAGFVSDHYGILLKVGASK